MARPKTPDRTRLEIRVSEHLKTYLDDLSDFLDLPKNQVVLMSLLWFGLDIRKSGYVASDGGSVLRKLAGEMASKLKEAHSPELRSRTPPEDMQEPDPVAATA